MNLLGMSLGQRSTLISFFFTNMDRFQDIQGKGHKAPYFETRAKLRYDDKYLYIGGMLEESNLWANLTKNNSIIYYDNDFEVLFSFSIFVSLFYFPI
jgi:hypothetical protein